jgi:hypothetical protein
MIAMEPPIEHRDVTTIMAPLGNIDENVAAIRSHGGRRWRRSIGR